MAGEIVKTEGVVLQIRPWSRTSHVVTWLTPDHGPVATLVKGAVRPKSAFLGQYDLFYTCDLLYYARASAGGDLHPLREVTPTILREGLRGRWRETALAGYAAGLVRDLAPAGAEARSWYGFLSQFLDDLASAFPATRYRMLIRLEMAVLQLAGLAPDFSGMDPAAEWTSFAIDHGHCGEGACTVRLTPSSVAALRGAPGANEDSAVRFLGIFLSYHLERPMDVRRSLVSLLSHPSGT